MAAALCLCAGSTLDAGAQARVDRKAAASAIVKADQAFCQAAIDRNLDRFLSFVADEATFSGGAAPLRGKDAVAQGWAPYFREGGPTLTWKPIKAEVLVGGDVGYTVGTWERRASGPDGKPSIARGNYLTVWKKQADDTWKAVFDTGSTEPSK
jgi:ketosteroid isomerase-like protein